MIFLGGVSAYLVDLRVNAPVELNRQAMFEAVKIEDAVFHTKLTAKLRAQPTVAQQLPRGLFRLRGARPQFANSRSGIRIG